MIEVKNALQPSEEDAVQNASNTGLLKNHLQLKHNSSETSVEFNQVFRLSYPKNFHSLYVAEAFAPIYKTEMKRAVVLAEDSPKEKEETRVGENAPVLQEVVHRSIMRSQRILVDMRPLRWYREYDFLKEQLDHFSFEKGELTDAFKFAKDVLKQLTNEEKADMQPESKYMKSKKHYQAVRQKLLENNKCTDLLKEHKKRLFREIQMNDFIIKEKFDTFEIYRKVPIDSELSPTLPILEDCFLGASREGQSNWERLKKILEDSTRSILVQLPPKKKKYDEELELLERFEHMVRHFILVEDFKASEEQCLLNLSNVVTTLPNEASISAATKDIILREIGAAVAGTPVDQAKIYACDETESNKVIKEVLFIFQQLTNWRVELSVNNRPKDARDINKIHKQRQDFLKQWSDPKAYISGFKYELVSRENDPFLEYLEKIDEQTRNVSKDKKGDYKKSATKYQTYSFKLTANGFYNQDGLSLKDFMKYSTADRADTILVLPYFDQSGVLSNEVFQVVVNPQPPQKFETPKTPVVKFIETQVLDISLQGYSLGEVRHSVNLMPGESKRIFVERKTKLSRTISEMRKDDSEKKQQHSSSFDENLQNELSSTVNVSQSDQQSHKLSKSSSHSDKSAAESLSDTMEQLSKASQSSWEVGIEASVGFGFASAKASTKFGGSSSDSSQNSNHDRSTQSSSRENALATSMTNEGQQMSKQSRDVATKNVQNTLRKVASETSQNNKLEVMSSSTEQSEDSTSHAEEIVLKNENAGRTANYNFFQLQNLYSTKIVLKDVKIFVKTGFELVEGTSIDDICVYELEEFNKMFSKTDESNSSAVLCAAIAYKILKQYTDLLSDEPKNKGFLRLADKDWKNGSILEQLKNLFKSLKLITLQHKHQGYFDFNQRFSELKLALKNLKKLTFYACDKMLKETTHVVNTPAYHVDSQLGLMPTTEPYLEERRRLELKAQENNLLKQAADIAQQEAITGNIQEMTRQKVFTTGARSIWAADPAKSSPIVDMTKVVPEVSESKGLK